MNEGFDLMEQLVRIAENLLTAVTGAAPRVLTGIVVVVLALVGAKIIERVLRAILTRLHFDKLLERIGLSKMLQRIGVTRSASLVLPRVIYYLLLFLFGQAAADALGLTAISAAISSFLSYLPNVVAALLLIVLGGLLSQYAGGMVKRAASESGIDIASTLGNLVSGLIFFIVAIMAIAQLKIDTEIVRIVTVCSLSGVALAFGLSFGLGSRETTGNIIAGFYAKKLFHPGDRVEVKGQTGEIQSMTAVQVVLRSDDGIVAIANTEFIDKVVKR